MQETQNEPNRESLEELMKKNFQLTQEIFEHTKKTRRYILISQILNVVKVLLIIGPIIIAIIYLPPIIREFLNVYSNLLGEGTGSTVMESGGFLEKLFQAKQ